ncbi:hypothetical protein JXA47_00155 [Candidatus Sumerlaeota bacterium]|nr:hypothetical protein [Candidatus Sumerlaeota bacterium]
MICRPAAQVVSAVHISLRIQLRTAFSLLILLCAQGVAAQHLPESSVLEPASAEEAAFRSLASFLQACDTSPETANLVIEDRVSFNLSEAQAARLISRMQETSGRPAPSAQEMDAARARLIERQSQPSTRRYVFMSDTAGRYHYELVEEVRASYWSDEEASRTRHNAIIQGPEGQWRFSESEENASHRLGSPGHDDFGHHTSATSWGHAVDLYLNPGALLEPIWQISHLEQITQASDEITATARVIGPPDSVVAFGFDPESDESQPPNWIVLHRPAESDAHLFRFIDWHEDGGILRPSRMERSAFEFPAGAHPSLTPAGLSSQLPVMRSELRALHMRFNQPLSDSVFEYDPPSDYLVIAHRADGTVDVSGPGSEPLERIQETVEEGQQRLSPRQRRIQERMGTATAASHRWKLALIVAGSALLVIGLGAMAIRSLRGNR